MKKILLLTLAGLSLLTAPFAQAWTYQNEQTLLIFRKPGFNNVEFNLGSVSNFLNHPDGYSTVVTNWSLSVVTSTFGADLTDDIRVIVLATTSSSSANRRAWISSADLNTQVYDQTPSAWQGQFYGKINAIGDKPQAYTGFSVTNLYVIAPTHISSYDYIGSDAGVNTANLPKLGGAVPFKVEQAIPATLKFLEIEPSSITPKPAASVVGTFTLSASGVLTFSVGSAATPPTPSSIVDVTRSAGVSAVTFTTTTNGQYWLRFANSVASPLANWPRVSGPMAGTGANQTLSHTNAGAAGFYRVETDQ